MSTIEKMSVQGIRSFGHEDTDKQVIKFYTPLTLILGPNGTGKTTIIECLKYMTTGVMPPGAAKGGAFVHDPKIAHEREVKGQVRLQFKDLCRKSVVAQRSINCSIKGKKTEMKTLDGVLTRLNAAGEKQSITSKCADMDREMITSLGVSKAVLENVIFCHQEEANWPLSEGKQLKEKFDAIFASTRYVKALENIKKVRKEQDLKMKSYKEVILYLRQNKDKSLQFQCDLTEQEGKLEASKASVEKYKQNLQPIEVKLDKIDAKSAEIYEINSEITKHSSGKTEIEKHAKELQKQIKNKFQGTDEELKRTLAEFKDKLEERQQTLQEFEQRNAELTRQGEKLDKERSSILVDVGRLKQEAERQKENVKKRDKKIHEHAEEYDFEGLSGVITDDKYQLFLKNMQNKLESMMSNAREIKTSFEVEEKEIQTKIDDLRDTKTQLEQSERMKKNMMSENSSKIKDINKKLSEIEASGARLDQLKRELKRHEHDLQTKEATVNTDDLKKEIVDMNREKSKLDAKISELSSEMNQLTLQSNAQAQLDVLKRDKSAKEECIRQMKAKHEDTVKHLFGHVPGRNIRVQLEEYIGKQSDDVRKCNSEMNQSKNNLSKLETQRKMNMETLKQKESEIRGIEEKIYTVCGSQNFDEGLETIQEKMEKSRDQRGSLLGAEHFFKKYTDDLEKENPGCPLCHRAFETEQEIRDLISDLNKKLRMVPSKMEKAEREIEQYQEKYESLLKLQPLKENIVSLESNDIPKLKNTLKKCQDEIQKLTDKVTDLEDDLSMKETDESMAKDIHPDIVVMDRYYGEITELDKKIAVQASKLTGGDSGRTLQIVIDEKDDLQVKVDSLSHRLDQKRQKLTDHSDKVQELRTSINGLREEKLSIENDLQQRIKLEEDKLNLETENHNHQQEIREASERIRPLQANMDKLKREKDKIIQEKDDKVETAKAEVEIVKGHATGVRNINHEIKRYNQSGKADSLSESLERKGKLEAELEELYEEKKGIETNIDKLRKDLSNQKVRELDLQSNMALRGKKKECDTLSRKIDTLQDKLGDIDVAFLSREKRQLEKQVENLTKELHTAEGRQRGFEDQIKSIKKELNSDAFKDAEQKYREKQIDYRTTELAIGDLDRYSKALDRAIMNYHNLKMEEINKIIRELWRNTYKGNDIETIEIRSDEDETDIIKTRKVYNYRVVMIKPGGAVIDMRGRCSAGQKVLASLIIRLGLAETFCLNCGILALDEPTTNLDRENIESLACGLVEIIKARSHQRNFQLVVITHDEDFVELLGRSEYVDEFYRISKNQYGNSQITCSKVQALHA